MEEILIPYSPRPIWENELHRELDKHRFAVIVAHRRFGKTVGMVNQLIKKNNQDYTKDTIMDCFLTKTVI